VPRRVANDSTFAGQAVGWQAMRKGSVPGGGRTSRTRASSSARPARVRDAAPPSSSSPASGTGKRARDPLLAAICHDLRAPLAAVTMGANFVLQTTKRDDENARSVKILEAMLRSCTQMERLIRNFADLSEIEGHAVALRLGVHDAAEMIELAAEAAGEAAGARSITLEVVKPESPFSIRCDRERLLRAIGHVVENAVKHAPAGSTVTLSVTQRDAMVAFAIVDRGPGLSAQVRRNLFDRQWHAKRANRVGTGFGLAIARGFVSAHGGRIVVESRPNSVTSFTLSVPKNGPKDDAPPRSRRQ
jgi:signal transduction histidine kinase